MLDTKDIDVYANIKETMPREIRCARQIGSYIENTLKKTITEEEIFYLALHISRVV